MSMLTEMQYPILGFLVTLASGFWVGRVGRPYNGFLFNLHKLIALGTIIVTTIQVVQPMKPLEPRSLLIVSIVAAVISVVALFASGAFLSIGSLDYQAMKTVHNIAPVWTVIAILAAFFLLNGKI